MATPITFEEMSRRLDALSEVERERGAKMFMGRPDTWCDGFKWRCPNNHVSDRFLKSEAYGDLCLACKRRVRLTFPKDVDGTELPDVSVP